MSARAALRAATAEDHDRVDRLYSAFDLEDLDHYGRFLRAQAAAHLPIEAALDQAGAADFLDDWPLRRRSPLLVADLAELGLPIPQPIEPPPLRGAEQVLGAIYVLEGSRLGGALLKRGLSAGAPQRFLDAEQTPGAWRKLLAKLDESLYEPARAGVASEAAKQIFRRFEVSARRFVETAQA